MTLLQALQVEQNELWNLESFLSLAGASAITLIVSTVMQHVTGKNPKWFALAIAIIVSYLGVFFVKSENNWVTYVIAFFNGFLIYANAVGIIQMLGRKQDEARLTAGDSTVKAFDRWF